MQTFQKINAPSDALRQNYLNSLPQPQEWFLEERIAQGEVWEFPEAGYAVFHDDTLVAFHVEGSHDGPSQLEMLKTVRPFESVLCQSFDAVLRRAATTLGGVASEVAHLFRKRVTVGLIQPEGFRLDIAKDGDLESAFNLGAGFFATRQEVDDLGQSGQLWIARCHSDIVGCGVTYPVDGPYGATDVGMVVHPSKRNRGFGAAIISALSDMLELDGRMPICGCARHNAASKAALEKAGFVSEHCLLRFDFPASN